MKKVKWGCIGCGGIADRRTLPGMMLSDIAELVAVCDTNPEATKRVQEKYGAKYSFTDPCELLALEEIEAVYIASPVFCHYEQVKAAADAGKAILLEKPMGLTSDAACEMTEYCEQKGILLGVGFMMRFAAFHQKMREYVQAGKLGKIVSMRGRLDCWYPPMQNCWRQQMATSGGGSMMDMAIHCIDLLQYITGLKSVEVTGFVDNQVHDYESEDGGSFVIRMDNGAFMSVDANFNVPYSRCEIEILGTDGGLFAEGTVGQVEGGSVRFITADKVTCEPTIEELKVDFGNMYTKEIDAFSKAVIENTSAPVTPQEAILNQRIVELGYLSSKDSRAYKID